MNSKKSFIVFLLFLGFAMLHAQIKIGDNPGTLNSAALLEIESSNKGLLLPRLSSNAVITTPVEGMLIYNKSTRSVEGYANGKWILLGVEDNIYTKNDVINANRTIDLENFSELRLGNSKNGNAGSVNIAGPLSVGGGLIVKGKLSTVDGSGNKTLEVDSATGNIKGKGNLTVVGFATAWSNVGSYTQNDLVLYKGIFYRNKAGAAGNPPDNDSTNWENKTTSDNLYATSGELKSDRTVTLGSNTLSFTGSGVVSVGKNFAASGNISATDISASNELTVGNSLKVNADKLVVVSTGDVSTKGTVSSRGDITGNNFKTTAGSLKSSAFSTIWDSGGTYARNSIVIYNGRFYLSRSGASTNQNPSLDIRNWEDKDALNNFYSKDGTLAENRTINKGGNTLGIIGTGNVSTSGGFLASGDIEGKDITASGDLSAGGNLLVNTDKLIVNGASGNVTTKGFFTAGGDISGKNLTASGDLSVTKDFAVATDKFKVVALTGDASTKGTLDVADKITGGNFIMLGDLKTKTFSTVWTSGATYARDEVVLHNGGFYRNKAGGISTSEPSSTSADWEGLVGASSNNLYTKNGTLASDRTIDTDGKILSITGGGNFSVGKDFTVGNTVGGNTVGGSISGKNLTASGDLSVTKDFAVAGDKFKVVASSGDASTKGTLGVAGDITGANFKTAGNLKTSAFSTVWTNGATYATDFVVLHKGVFYKKKVGATNSEPSSTSTDWEGLGTSNILYSKNGTLTENRTIDTDGYALKITGGGNFSVGKNFTVGNNTVGGNISGKNLTASGDLSVTKDFAVGTADQFKVVASSGNASTKGTLGVTGDITGANLKTAGDLKAKIFSTVWTSGATYATSDVVLHKGDFYKKTTSVTNSEPSSTSTDWEGGLVGASNNNLYTKDGTLTGPRTIDTNGNTLSITGTGNFSVGKDFTVGNTVGGNISGKNLTASGKLSTMGDLSAANNNFKVIASSGDASTKTLGVTGDITGANFKTVGNLKTNAFSTVWTSGATYATNDVVLHKGVFYKKKVGATNSEPSFTSADWEGLVGLNTLYTNNGTLTGNREINTAGNTLSITGDGDVSVGKDFTVTENISGKNLTVSGGLSVTKDFAVAGDKFKVIASSGDASTKGTLGVTGDISGGNFITVGNLKTSTFSTVWTSGATYAANDVVLHKGDFYKKKAGGISTSEPSSTSADWENEKIANNLYTNNGELKSDRTVTLGSNTLSFTGSGVVSVGKNFAASGNISATDISASNELTVGNSLKVNADNLVVASTGDVSTKGTVSSRGDITGNNFITAGSLKSSAFSTIWNGGTYAKNSVVIHNGRIYRKRNDSNTTTDPSRDIANWEDKDAVNNFYVSNGALAGNRAINKGPSTLSITGTGNVSTSGGFLASGDIEGKNITASGNLSTGGNLLVNTDKLIVNGASGNVTTKGFFTAEGDISGKNLTASKNLSAAGNFAVATDKFKVVASTGDASTKGTLGVTGDISGGNFITAGNLKTDTFFTVWTSGATYVANDVVLHNNGSFYRNIAGNNASEPSSTSTDWEDLGAPNNLYTKNGTLTGNREINTAGNTLSITGGGIFSVGKNFTVTENIISGENLTASGDLSVAENFAVAGDKFKVIALTGDASTKGTLGVSGDISGGNFITAGNLKTKTFSTVWTSGATYVRDEIVLHKGSFYRNMAGKNTSEPSPTSTDWDGSVGAPNNLYTKNGALTGNREIKTAGNTLSITGTGAVSTLGDFEATGDITGANVTVNPQGRGKATVKGNIEVNTDKFVVNPTTNTVEIKGKLTAVGNIRATSFETLSGNLNASTFATNWTSGATYVAGFVVLHDGIFYKKTASATNLEPSPTSADWNPIGVSNNIYVNDGTLTAARSIDNNGKTLSIKGTGVVSVEKNVTVAGDVTADNYITAGNITADKGFLIADGFSSNWSNTQTYSTGDVVVYDGGLYRNISGFNSSTTPNFDTTNWSLNLYIWNVQKGLYANPLPGNVDNTVAPTHTLVQYTNGVDKFYKITLNTDPKNVIVGTGKVPDNVWLSVNRDSRFVDGTNSTEAVYAESGVVGIGLGNPKPDALLTLESTTKGFLLPRMTSAERKAIGVPAAGLQVYDTDTKNIWTHNGSIWVSSSPRRIGTGFQKSLFLGDAGPASGIVTHESLGIGYGTLSRAKSSLNNTAVGYGALKGNNDQANLQLYGRDNVAIGTNAMASTSYASGNVAVGSKALESIIGSVKGRFNVAVGNNALNKLTYGSDNIGLGINAATSITTGSQNIAIGNLAGSKVPEKTKNSIMIGFNANVSGDNSLNIGDWITGENGEITMNSLTTDTFSTKWSASGSYSIKDVVLYEGEFYRNIKGDNNPAITPDKDLTNWQDMILIETIYEKDGFLQSDRTITTNGQSLAVKRGNDNLLFVNAINKNVGIGTNSPNANAILDLKSNTKGFLLPRLTGVEKSRINGLGTADAGLKIYNTTDSEINYWDGTSWWAFNGETENRLPIIKGYLDREYAIVNDIVSANYSFYDEDGDEERFAKATYKWFRKTSAAAVATDTGVTGPFYTITTADLNKKIFVEITTAARVGDITIITTKSPEISVFSDLPPKVTNVAITGKLKSGETLIPTYTYTDVQPESASATEYQWYLADDILGTNRVIVSPFSTANKQLRLAPNMIGKYIGVGIKTKSQAGIGVNPNFSTESGSLRGRVQDNFPIVISKILLSTKPPSEHGEIEVVSYTTIDSEGDAEDTASAVYHWQVEDANNNWVFLAGNAKKISVPKGFLGKKIRVSVSSRSKTGNISPTSLYSAPTAPIIANKPPTVNPTISFFDGQTISTDNKRYVKLTYTYLDEENNEEDTNRRVVNFYKQLGNNKALQLKEVGKTLTTLAYDLYDPANPYNAGGNIQLGVIASQGIGGQSAEAFSNILIYENEAPKVADVKINHAIFGAESKVSYTYSDKENNPEKTTALKVTWYKVRAGIETKLEENIEKLTYRVSTGFESGDILRVKVQAMAEEGNATYSNVGTVDKTIDPLSYTIPAKIAATARLGTTTVQGSRYLTIVGETFHGMINTYLINNLTIAESNFILANRDAYTITIRLGDRRDIAINRLGSYVIPNVETENSVALTLGGAAYPFKVTLTSDGSITVQDSHGGKPNKYGAVRGLTVTIP